MNTLRHSEVIKSMGILNIVFALGIAGMVVGSVMAIREKNLKRMIAYSSVAQIGYIYAGIGLGTWAGLAAALFHMIVHAFTKPLLFSAAGGLIEVSGHSKMIADMKGAGRRNKWAGFGFLVGALSMVGFPIFGGFTSKVYLALGAQDNKMVLLLALAISSCLNAIYYMPVVLRIFSKESSEDVGNAEGLVASSGSVLSIACFSVINIALGIGGFIVMAMLMQGVQML